MRSWAGMMVLLPLGLWSAVVDAQEPAPWQQLTTDGLFKQRPAFSPDGQLLVYSRHVEDKIQLIQRELTTGAESRVTDRTDPEFDAVFSPDGKQLLFAFDMTTPNQGNMEVYSLTLADKTLTKLAGDTGGLAHEESPCWSPEGTQFAFTSTRDGNQELYVAQADGSEPRRLTSDPAIDAHPAWSPDGQRIIFSTNRWGDLELASIHPDGTGLTQLTSSPGMDDYPAWSPDGKQIAFTSARSGQLEIFVMDVAGGPPRNVTQSAALENFPAWTPTGQLAFVSNREGGFDIYQVSVAE